MVTIKIIDNHGKFRGSFVSIRDANNHAQHQHITKYSLKKIKNNK